jgi:chitinase
LNPFLLTLIRNSMKSAVVLCYLILSVYALATSAKHVIGYYTAWSTYGRNYQVYDLPETQLTHVYYAFANIQNGRCVLGDPYADIEKMFPGDSWYDPIKGNFGQLIKMKERNPNLKTLISVGGWTWSTYFSDVALTEASREIFVQSCVEFMLDYQFDGIDIDWEYPVEGGLETNIYRPEDGVNHALLMAKFRSELDRIGGPGKYLLTIAAPAGSKQYRHLKLADLANSLDYVLLMTYDYCGAWSNVTCHQSAIYYNQTDPFYQDGFYADKGLKDYIAGGMPREKLLLGAAFYGRGFNQVASSQNNGLFQPFNGIPQGTWEPGMADYDDITNNMIGNGYYAYYDSQAKGSWAYNPSTRIMWSYDSAQVIQDKAAYVNQNGHAGVFFWEASADRSGELSKILYDNLVLKQE